MSKPAAKQGDKVTGLDIHIVMIPSPGGEIPTPLPHPFNGIIDGGVSKNVMIEGKAAAILGCTAKNTPPHIPAGPRFQKQPKNQGKVITGSSSVFINNKPAVRAGDTAMTCNDPSDLPNGKVVAVGKVFIGG